MALEVGSRLGHYDVTGDRFLMIKEDPAVAELPEPQVVLIQNWTEELQRLVPVD